jgi:hypothetical protein
MLTEEQARRNARLMGILYGVVIAMEMAGETITYAEIERIMQKHCTSSELAAVVNELQRYNTIVLMSK